MIGIDSVGPNEVSGFAEMSSSVMPNSCLLWTDEFRAWMAFSQLACFKFDR
jgi:hypothetical protein